MNEGEYFRLLKAKENQSLVVYSPPRRNRLASFILSHTIIAACILFSAVVASGYFVYQKSPEFRHSIDKIFSSASEAIKPDYSQKTAQVILTRGNALRAKGRYGEAEHAYKASLEKFASKDDYLGQGNVFTEMGILYTRTGDYKSAEKQFQQALGFFGWTESLDGLGYANSNLGQLYFIQGQFRAAEKFFLTSEHHYKASGNQEGLEMSPLPWAICTMQLNYIQKR